MFAPYCPSCRSRVLLGTRRIVYFAADRVGGRHRVVLQCFCGALLDWDQHPPRPDVSAAGQGRVKTHA